MNSHDKLIAVATEIPGLQEHAQEQATHLNLPLVSIDDDSYNYLLILSPVEAAPGYLLALHKTGKKAPGPVFTEFVSGAMGHRRKFGGGRNQELARAVGIKAGVNPTILDATAGLGRDGFVLATLGCKVTLVERSPIIHALLQNGLERARSDKDTFSIIDRIQLVCSNSIEYLHKLPADNRPDTIYLDPMFPHRSKTALVKKEMRFFQEILGEDLDGHILLESACKSARKRVVVKRPKSAPPIHGKPDTSISSKNTRYDIYLIHVMD